MLKFLAVLNAIVGTFFYSVAITLIIFLVSGDSSTTGLTGLGRGVAVYLIVVLVLLLLGYIFTPFISKRIDNKITEQSAINSTVGIATNYVKVVWSVVLFFTGIFWLAAALFNPDGGSQVIFGLALAAAFISLSVYLSRHSHK